ncbi:hypothetical protein PQX77_012125 [Marasmius sp. AFHP31]|nr:hypothetical protein PQX77_012125 [Marasmius sp. AFHP31]
MTKAYLLQRFPLLRSPTLSDLHISLTNRSHLKVYIDAIKKECFPEGTGWKGLLYLKAQQDHLLDSDDHYIRIVEEFSLDGLENFLDDDDDEELLANGEVDANVLRMVVCMTPDGSERLACAQYLQSDIAFQRIVGFYEFEISALDRNSNTNVTFCRVFLTRKNAIAHQLALRAINRILKQDVGRGLQWRHIHGTQIDDYGDGQYVLNWVVDQDRGQALGIGRYLVEVSRQFPTKADLHEPGRLLIDLGPYDHAARFLTLCTVHFGRNIRGCGVSEEVRNLMRSLLCEQHSEWEETLKAIRDLGGKAGSDWLADKETLPFVFPAICWEKSYIPRDVWLARPHSTNTAESVHRDVNREGVRCTLVGATKKGMHFDLLKLKSLKSFQDSRVRETYKSKHPFENALAALKKKDSFRRRSLGNADHKIKSHNQKMESSLQKLDAGRLKASEAARRLDGICSERQAERYERAHKAFVKARDAEVKLQQAYDRQVEHGKTLLKTGSGKTGILLPASSLEHGS